MSNRSALLAVLLLLSASAAPVVAATPEESARNTGCIACHMADAKLVGPSWKEIAAKYKGDAKAPANLAARLRVGGTGVWGQVPMPATPKERISDEDLAALVEWVLAH
jgi:cytochrome c